VNFTKELCSASNQITSQQWHWVLVYEHPGNKSFLVLFCATHNNFGVHMLTVNIRKQGGASVITIPPDVLRTLHIGVGATLSIEFVEGAVTLRPVTRNSRKRYTLAELLQGVTPEVMTALNEDTAWAREGEAVGRELS
jgi:antitoxin ChpS